MNETQAPERKRLTIRQAEHALRHAGFSRREAARIAHGGFRYAFLIVSPPNVAPRRWWKFWQKGVNK